MDSKEACSSSGLFAKSPSVALDDDDEPIALSCARASPLLGISMDSHMQNFHNNRAHMTPHPPPPVAMSLRTRETASMAMKHIFDQQISNNGASSREQEYRPHHMGGFQGIRNQSMPDLRKRIPDLDLTFKKSRDDNLQDEQVGFGSPISTPTNQGLPPQASLPQMNGQLMHHNYVPQAAASTRLTPSSRQSTAQMTIFYSGNVNVYEDVPADKAYAIMLLAGSSGSSSFKCPAPPSATAVAPAETMIIRERATSPVKVTPSQHTTVTASTNNNGGSISICFGSPAPTPSVAATSLASTPSSPALQAPAPLADATKSSQSGAGVKRPHAGIELPHARKASLARFLEKRKDRVQVQQQDQQGVVASEGESQSCIDKPEKICSYSRSSSPSWSNSKGNSTNYHATDGIRSANGQGHFH